MNMNKEIKFRGKTKDGWVCDDVRGYWSTYNYADVDPNTVGQYTGLKDNNGVEIYEGDIIYSEFDDGSNTKCLVGWNDDMHCDGLMDECAYRAKREGYSYPEFSPELMSNFIKHSKVFKVIGNIFDNPELLEKE